MLDPREAAIPSTALAQRQHEPWFPATLVPLKVQKSGGFRGPGMQGPGLCNGCIELTDCFSSAMPACAATVDSLAESAVSCSEMLFRNCSDESVDGDDSGEGLDAKSIRSLCSSAMLALIDSNDWRLVGFGVEGEDWRAEDLINDFFFFFKTHHLLHQQGRDHKICQTVYIQ